MSNMKKLCSGCGEAKSLGEFEVPTNYGGIRERKWCHDCCEKLLERQRKSDKRLRDFAKHEAQRNL